MSEGRHRSGHRSRSPGRRRFLLFAPARPAGRRRRGRSPVPPDAPAGREAAATAAALAGLAAQLEALRLEVAVLGGRIDAVAARIERLAATPPAVPAVAPPRHAHALRLPLLRAALSQPVADGSPTTAGATAPAADPPAASGAPSAGPAAPERPGAHRRVVA